MKDSSEPTAFSETTDSYYVPPHFTEVEVFQEKLYLGEWDSERLIKILKNKVLKLLSPQADLVGLQAVIRILREATDPQIPSGLFSIVDETFEEETYGIELWATDIGRVLILDFLDIIMEYKRADDIPRIMGMMSWELFHIPSHILMLTRKYRWHQLWDAICGRWDLESEYDPQIRAQHFLTEEALKGEPTSESALLQAHQKELVALQSVARRATTPVVYVEGKTDRMILDIAYSKLFPNEKRPFLIKECDVIGGAAGGAGGAQTLSRLISSIRQDSTYAALALFDHDKEGIDAYNKLPAYFCNRPQPQYRPGKISQSGRAAALLLPSSGGREKYSDLLNLSIEFLFEDEVLSLKNLSGKGLVFNFPDLEIRVKKNGNPLVEVRRSDLSETREIVGGKMEFAKDIVPALDAVHFHRFKNLFWMVKDILLTDMKPSEGD
ncbi:hypothetical protein HDG34_006118 [Paraburkholderia sp. HC6.4b]|uniref:hypothetical protein n=1 Tax=unclassified Paraburkholderia TaxID=2615204 RepID=UPI00161D0857|nr:MULTISPECIES: hypothetical protein [unclassified Paraburkholderia]MBB5412147.1 hypothetical protein [Paraburkholderia sp. HC6.4b]MBB5454214.1 hypothetical protein [Paraburkholderia sp. Kb1A]